MPNAHHMRIRELAARGTIIPTVKRSFHQYRADIIASNMSTAERPKSPKAPKPIAQQAKGSARVRTYDAPTDMGQASARFADPVGGAFKARLEHAMKAIYDPLWIGFPGTSDRQPDGDDWLTDARYQDAMAQWLVVNYRNAFKPYPIGALFPELNPLTDASATPGTHVPGTGKASWNKWVKAHAAHWVRVHAAGNTAPEPHRAPLTGDLPVMHTIDRLPACRDVPCFSLAKNPSVPTAKVRPVLVSVTKDGNDITGMESLSWNNKAFKRLFDRNRFKPASRTATKTVTVEIDDQDVPLDRKNHNARAVCYRLTPKIPNSTIRAVSA